METAFYENEIFKNQFSAKKETKTAEFENCSFLNCDFSNGVFASCKFIDSMFIGCDLSMLKLTNSQLNNIEFKDCKLIGVNFSDCYNLPFLVKFQGCILDYSSFAGKKMLKTAFIRSSLKNSDFTGCDLTGSVFSESNLLNAIFNKTILKEVDFVGAFNYSIDPEINTIKKAKFALAGIAGLLNKYDINIE